MALIKCPECGQDVSDKSTQCIHCGYPLSIQKDSAYDIIYNGFENNSLKYKCQAKMIGCIRQLLKLDLTTAKRIIDNPPYTLFHSVSKEQAEWIVTTLKPFQCNVTANKSNSDIQPNIEIDSYMSNGSTLICPRCGSNEVVTGQKGFSLLTGFIGSNKTINRCGKCGYKWEP